MRPGNEDREDRNEFLASQLLPVDICMDDVAQQAGARAFKILVRLLGHILLELADRPRDFQLSFFTVVGIGLCDHGICPGPELFKIFRRQSELVRNDK